MTNRLLKLPNTQKRQSIQKASQKPKVQLQTI